MTEDWWKAIEKLGYEFKSLIVHGKFSAVYKCSYRKYEIAMKVIDLNQVESRSFLERFIPREIETMKILKNFPHPSIIGVQAIIRRDNFLFMSTRLAEKGTLLDILSKHKIIHEVKMKKWFYQMVNGIDFLHNHLGIAHRDLKLANIFITKNNNIKIGDFGFAKIVTQDHHDLSTTFCGSMGYCAPEILKRNPHKEFLTDIFSLGVVLFVCLNGKMPYCTRNTDQMMLSQAAQIFHFADVELSEECLEVIYACMKPKPSHRPLTGKLLQMNWLLK